MVTNEDIAQKFLNVVAASGEVNSLSTVDWYRKRLKTFLAWADGGDILDAGMFNAFVLHLKERMEKGTLSPATINGYYRILRRFGKWLYNEGITERNPARALTKPKRAKLPPKALTDDEVSKMIEAARGKPRETAIVFCLLRTGARAEELLQLTWGHIDWRASPARTLVKGKGNKLRWIFFAPDAVAALRQYRAWLPKECRGNDQPIWWGHRNGKWRPLGYSGFYLALKRLARNVGVEHYSPHKWRHYFAVSRRRKNQSLSDVQDLLGHASPETTKIYDQLTADQLGEAYMRFV